MRVFGIVAFLAFVVVPVPIFAQQGGGGGGGGSTSSISTDFGDSFGGVQNVSAQAAGTFVGAGVPSGFVGVTEIYNRSSSRSMTTSRTTVARTTVRPLTMATTAQRRVATSTARGAMGNLNNQTIRSITSVDFDFAMPPQRVQPTALETNLNRVYGIQDGQVAFNTSPAGTTVVLTGTVPSDRERRVAQQLLLLEPGVSRVENLLEIR